MAQQIAEQYAAKIANAFVIDQTKIAWNLFRKLSNVFEGFTVQIETIDIVMIFVIWVAVLLVVMMVAYSWLRKIDVKKILLGED